MSPQNVTTYVVMVNSASPFWKGAHYHNLRLLSSSLTLCTFCYFFTRDSIHLFQIFILMTTYFQKHSLLFIKFFFWFFDRDIAQHFLRILCFFCFKKEIENIMKCPSHEAWSSLPSWKSDRNLFFAISSFRLSFLS